MVILFKIHIYLAGHISGVGRHVFDTIKCFLHSLPQKRIREMCYLCVSRVPQSDLKSPEPKRLNFLLRKVTMGKSYNSLRTTKVRWS